MSKGSLIFCALLTTPALAAAQPAAPVPEGADAASDSGDIVVTARRREERLQQVPVSMTAIAGEGLAKVGIRNSRDLITSVPGLVFAQAGATVQPSIRGVGNRSTGRSNDPSVAIYIDGFYYPSTAGSAFDLPNLQRVEVLRGPQGTLFGRNATGGLINFITVDPQFSPSGKLIVRYGSFNEASAKAYVTGPISDKIAADLSLSAYRDSGYIVDLVNGGHANPRRTFSVRSKWLFQLGDDTRLTLTGAYNSTNDPTPQTYQPLNQNTIGRTLATVLPTKPRQTATSAATPIIIKFKQKTATARLTHDFDAATLFLESSYQSDHSPNSADSDGSTPVLAGLTALKAGFEAETAEARLVSSGSGRFQWIAGVFGFRAYSYTLPQVNPTFTNQVLVRNTNLYSKNWTHSLAGFVEANYAVTPELHLTAGGRYTYEERHFSARQDVVTVATGATTTTSFNGKINFKRFTPRAVVQYIFSPRVNVYASYSRGFKSGFFNTTSVAGSSVRPEDLDAYEIGFKSEPIPGILVNGAAYKYKYKNLQVSARDPVSGASTTQNAAQSNIKGAELEVVASLSHDTRFRLGASYNDAIYTKFLAAQVTVPLPSGAGNSQIFKDVSGNHLPRTPVFTANAGLDHTQHFENGNLGLAVNAYYSGKNYYEPLNRITQKAYVIINGEVSWQFDNGVRAAIWVENLANEDVLLTAVPSTNGDMVVYDRPRRIGVSIGYQF